MSKNSLSLIDIIKKYEQAPALICDKKSYSYLEYGQLVENAVNRLKANGIKKNDRVALLSDNSCYYPPVLISLFQIGAVAVPINRRLPVGNISSFLKKINCSKLIVDGNNLHSFQKMQIIELEKLFYTNRNRPFNLIKFPLSLQQDATIIYTSGSSGEPKAALHSLGNHHYSAIGSNLNISLSKGDRWLLSLPLYHIAGLAILFRTLISGASIVIQDSRLSITENIERFKVTHISLVSTQLYRLLQDEYSIKTLRSLKVILLGGGRISESLLKKSIENGLSIYTTYGSTELASQVCTTGNGGTLDLLQTAGKILKYRQMKLAADGEILLKGKTLFKGYVEAGGINVNRKDNGWFKTGDIGKIDNNGNLSIIGRKDNMFISGGENIHPEEVEQCLLQLPQVEKAIVVSVSDDEFGERPVAFIKSTGNQTTDISKIIKQLEEKIPSFKLPDYFLPWPETEENLKPDRLLFKKIAKKMEGRNINL